MHRWVKPLVPRLPDRQPAITSSIGVDSPAALANAAGARTSTSISIPRPSSKSCSSDGLCSGAAPVRAARVTFG